MMHTDPAHTLEKILELLLYLVVGGVAGVLVDRERKRQGELFAALAEQRRMADQLVRAGRLAALGELVAGIAHEIKNPLHALRGTAEVVDPLVPKDSPENRMWQLHLKELDRLGQVADRFLSFARPAPLARKELKLADVVQRAHDLIEAQARQQDVRVSVEPVTFDVASDVASDVAGHVFADEQQLAQVLLNIGINGLQAMEAGGGDLRFSMRQDRRGDQDFAVVCLTNSGPPIPKADIERIFDPFVTSKSDGVGLGLSIANRIVEQHGGFLEAENLSDPTGVRFSVYLPHER
jgi:signal transduction histidine kinase